ncbi:MAG: monofunctional biosynthetic peptidoglycan transglycosylase [Pseudomonadota bacterium]
MAKVKNGNKKRPPRRRMRLWQRLLVMLFAVVVVLPVLLIALFAAVPPPVTPLMLIRQSEGYGIDKQWVALDDISTNLPAAVIAAEDNNFCIHRGFDWDQIEKAVATYQDGGNLRGASTITQQTAKNLFLWPARSFIRKGIEAWLAVLIDLLWSKQRILEVYLNIVEWSGGVYGAEAAAQHYFGKSAANLSQREAALLATVLPNPLNRSASNPTSSQVSHADVLQRRIGQLGPLLDCY